MRTSRIGSSTRNWCAEHLDMAEHQLTHRLAPTPAVEDEWGRPMAGSSICKSLVIETFFKVDLPFDGNYLWDDFGELLLYFGSKL